MGNCSRFWKEAAGLIILLVTDFPHGFFNHVSDTSYVFQHSIQIIRNNNYKLEIRHNILFMYIPFQNFNFQGTKGAMWPTRKGAWRSRAGGVFLPPEANVERQGSPSLSPARWMYPEEFNRPLQSLGSF